MSDQANYTKTNCSSVCTKTKQSQKRLSYMFLREWNMLIRHFALFPPQRRYGISLTGPVKGSSAPPSGCWFSSVKHEISSIMPNLLFVYWFPRHSMDHSAVVGGRQGFFKRKLQSQTFSLFYWMTWSRMEPTPLYISDHPQTIGRPHWSSDQGGFN